MRRQIVIVGAPARTQLLALAHERAGLSASQLTLREAALSPSALVGACLALFAVRPGTAPALEAQAYLLDHGCLYVTWGRDSAIVGPHATRGLGPCPQCLASAHASLTHGASAALGSWAAAWAALQSVGIVHHAVSELVGASWRWQLSQPGLTLEAWPRSPACRTPGCTQL